MAEPTTPDVTSSEEAPLSGIFEDLEAVTPTEESSPTEPTEEASEPGEDKSEPDTEGTEAEAEAPTTEETTDEQPKRGAEARKEALNNEIRDLVSRRNQIRDEITAKNAEVYNVPSVDDLIAQGVDPLEARVSAWEQKQEMDAYNTRVSDLNSNMNVESLQVLNDLLCDRDRQAAPKPK